MTALHRLILKLALLVYLTGLYGSGFGRKAAAGVLEWMHGKAETKWTKPAEIFLGLCTIEVKENMTGATVTEVSYTTYARVPLKPADISTATEAQPSVMEYPEAQKLFNAVTAGGGTVISWFTSDSATIGAGNLLDFGQCTSTVLSTTNTPPTVAAKAIKVQIAAT